VIPYWDLFWIGLAKYYSSQSKDPSTKVGAVIVRPDNTPLSFGVNGFPSGMDDSPELFADRNIKIDRTIHAEMNALLWAKEPVRGCTIYVWPFISCDRCSIHLIQSGITRIVAPECPEHLRDRWEHLFAKSRSYFREKKVIVDEYPSEECDGLPNGPYRES
jgi:dCMP deaminase